VSSEPGAGQDDTLPFTVRQPTTAVVGVLNVGTGAADASHLAAVRYRNTADIAQAAPPSANYEYAKKASEPVAFCCSA
jgi:hypothetical protein